MVLCHHGVEQFHEQTLFSTVSRVLPRACDRTVTYSSTYLFYSTHHVIPIVPSIDLSSHSPYISRARLHAPLGCPIGGLTAAAIVDMCIEAGFASFPRGVCQAVCGETLQRSYRDACNCRALGFRFIDCSLRATGHTEPASSVGLALDAVSGADVKCGPGLRGTVVE